MCGNPASRRLAINAPIESTIPRISDFWRKRKMDGPESTICTNVVPRPASLTRDHLHFLQRFGGGRAQHPAFGDDRRHIFCRRHIKCRIAYANTVGCELLSAVMRHFNRVALLNRNCIPGWRCEVDCGPGRGTVERDAMFSGENRNVVSAN